LNNRRGDSRIARWQHSPVAIVSTKNAWKRRSVAVGIAKGLCGGRFLNRPYRFVFRYFTDTIGMVTEAGPSGTPVSVLKKAISAAKRAC
ncbi:MAG: hypothetical protein IKD06_02395, partial [Clostridia bacterium]|nr:hypothetical protein [Clostridia bacterium]